MLRSECLGKQSINQSYIPYLTTSITRDHKLSTERRILQTVIYAPSRCLFQIVTIWLLFSIVRVRRRLYVNEVDYLSILVRHRLGHALFRSGVSSSSYLFKIEDGLSRQMTS